MYRCLDCGIYFDDPNITSSTHWEVGTRRDEPIRICPGCGSEDFEELKLCPCGLHHISSEKDWCQYCLDDVSGLAGRRYLDHEQAKELLEYWLSVN
jgi:predicted amidophosphoribosyltransferase